MDIRWLLIFLVEKYFRYILFQILQFVGGAVFYLFFYINFTGDYQVNNTNRHFYEVSYRLNLIVEIQITAAKMNSTETLTSFFLKLISHCRFLNMNSLQHCLFRLQDVVKLALRHNYTHMMQDVTPNDVVFFINTDIPSIPFVLVLFGGPFPAAAAGLVFVAFLTHRKIMLQMRTTSIENHKLQRNISLLLLTHVRISSSAIL